MRGLTHAGFAVKVHLEILTCGREGFLSSEVWAEHTDHQ
jgi:hypothetical protein